MDLVQKLEITIILLNTTITEKLPHSHWNFLYRKNDVFIPVIAHNNFGYDFHFIIRDLAARTKYWINYGLILSQK